MWEPLSDSELQVLVLVHSGVDSTVEILDRIRDQAEDQILRNISNLLDNNYMEKREGNTVFGLTAKGQECLIAHGKPMNESLLVGLLSGWETGRSSSAGMMPEQTRMTES